MPVSLCEYVCVSESFCALDIPVQRNRELLGEGLQIQTRERRGGMTGSTQGDTPSPTWSGDTRGHTHTHRDTHMHAVSVSLCAFLSGLVYASYGDASVCDWHTPRHLPI